MKNKHSFKKSGAALFVTLITIAFGLPAYACEACKKQQAKILQGVTHGRGPDSSWDYAIVLVMTVITLYVLIAAIRRIVRPSEKNANHIKRMILEN